MTKATRTIKVNEWTYQQLRSMAFKRKEPIYQTAEQAVLALRTLLSNGNSRKRSGSK